MEHIPFKGPPGGKVGLVEFRSFEDELHPCSNVIFSANKYIRKKQSSSSKTFDFKAVNTLRLAFLNVWPAPNVGPIRGLVSGSCAMQDLDEVIREFADARSLSSRQERFENSI